MLNGPAWEPRALNPQPTTAPLLIWGSAAPGVKELPPETGSFGLPFATNSIARGTAPVPATPLPLRAAQIPAPLPANQPLPQPINVDAWFGQGSAAASWREQQAAKQAAEQKAREAELEKLRGALDRMLTPPATEPTPKL